MFKKQFIKSQVQNESIVRVFTTSYGNSIEHINNLVNEAKKDFPELLDRDIRVVVLCGERYDKVIAIEFNSETSIPSTYFEWTRADDLGFCKTYN